MSNSPVLTCSAVGKTYHDAGTSLEVLANIEFSVEKGQRIAIIGSSGAGKSTFLNILGGLEAPTTGRVTVGGEDLYTTNEHERARIRNRQLGFVYQFHHLLPEFTALENVAMPLLLRQTGLTDVEGAAREILNAVGLSERVKHKPAQLSGGERQRVAVARALVTQPACVLMDEPTGNLDRHTAQDIQALIKQLNAERGISFIIVTHDLELAKTMDKTLELRDGGLFSPQ